MAPTLVAAGIFFATQLAAANLTGVVRDGDTGEPIPGALVRLTDLARVVVSDRTGRYTFPNVPSGPQHIDVRRIGFSPRSLHALVPARGTLELDVTMRPLPQRLRTIEVRPPALLSLDVPDAAQVAPERTLPATGIQHHPLLAEPDAFLALGSGAITLAPEAPTGVHAQGGSADQTAFLLNGIPVLSPYHAAGAFSAWNTDALERIRFSLPATTTGGPDVLSGTVSGDTRTPQPVLSTAGGVTTTHARFTADGPLGVGGAGFLLSLRAGFPGAVAPPDEPSYLRGNTRDLLATAEGRAFGGHVRLLAYENRNEFNASAVTAAVDPVPTDAPRNEFHWRSRSVGADWHGTWRGWPASARVWSASSASSSRWHGADSGIVVPLHLRAMRDDVGASAQTGDEDAAKGFQGAAWIRASRTRYAVRQDDGHALLTLDDHTPVAALEISRVQQLSERTWARFGLATYYGAGRLWLAPRIVTRSALSPTITLAASLSRGLQFTQSLRNPESVVSAIFPPELPVGAGVAGVPVGRSVDGLVSTEFRSRAGLGLRGVLWHRRMDGLLLSATTTAEPFAVDTFSIGSGTASGFAVDVSMSGSRYAALASYAWQRVRRSTNEVIYVPSHGSRHVAEAGAVLFPSPSFSFRTAVTLEGGRRGTRILGGLEWESCNLLDRGCEFGGSPRNDLTALGLISLPAYVRIDAGVRKHWHTRIAGRDAQVALHGTVTNLLSRANVLARIRSGTGAAEQPLRMRPFAPLVVGLDWRF